MRNTNQTRTNRYDLGHRQGRLFDSVRHAACPRLAEVLSLCGVVSERQVCQRPSYLRHARITGGLRHVITGMSQMSRLAASQLMGGKRRLATRPVEVRLQGASRGLVKHTPWRGACEPARPVVLSAIRQS